MKGMQLYIMKPMNKTALRLKKAKYQQLVISLSCMLLLVFSFGWMVRATVHTDKAIVKDDTSKVTQVEAKKDKVKKDSSNKIAESAKDNKGKDKKSDDESTDEDSSLVETDDDFGDAAFVGDSRTVGLEMNTDKPKASFYASIGLNVSTALTDNAVTLDNGNEGTVMQAMKQKKYKRIFVMFGINELGWPYPDVFVKEYEELVNQIKEAQPDAKIYVQSILPVSYLAANTNPVFTNENIDKFNEYVQKVAKDTKTEYLDVASAFKDENGALPVEASTDGIHFIREYCIEWMNYLAENT